MINAVSKVVPSSVALLLAICASTASGQWSSGEYEIFQLGLTRPEHTGATGFRFSQISSINRAGQIAGSTRRLLPGTSTGPNGESAWVWNPSDGVTRQIGLVDSAHTGSLGVQRSVIQRQTESGFVAGQSNRYSGGSAAQSAWVYDPRLQSTLEIGLLDASHTGTNGYRLSTVLASTSGDYIVGTTERISGTNTSNGTSAWVWSPRSGTTQRIGLFGEQHTGNGGRQVVTGVSASPSGFVYGGSQRFSGSQFLGRDTWLWNPTTETVVTTGLTGSEYTSPTGTQLSSNAGSGRSISMFGASARYTASGADNGSDAWVWTAASGASVRIGLTDAEHTSSSGRRTGGVSFVLDNGDGVGVTTRRLPNGTANGASTWVWSARTQQTIRTGILNEQTTSYNGVQESYNDFVSVASGHVAGNMRIQNTPTVASAWTWVWDPIQQTTVRSGLFSAEFISSRNEQVSRNRGMNSSGLVAGTSTRYSGFSSLGEATWAWTPQRGSERIGLFQGQFVASGGITQSSIQRVLENGLIVGQSSRYVGAQGAGLGFWVWDQSTGQTSEIGIPITLPNGSVLPDIVHINDMGFVSGRTARVTQSGSSGGFVSWTWNPLTRSTVRTGLDAPEYYGSTGYYESRASVYGANGAVAGFSLRYPANGSQSLGQDAWYFDPMTNLVHKPTEGVPNIVRADGLANSFPVLLTEEGFLLGTYLVFLDNSFVSNAFIFRPDVGFADLGMIVDGGLSPQGWLSIQAPTFGATASVLAGIGVRFDQNLNDGSQHVYAMRRVPTAGTGMLALLSCGLMGSRRRRRPENAWLLRGSA